MRKTIQQRQLAVLGKCDAANARLAAGHKLVIDSLHDAQAHCACGGWTYSLTGSATKDEIEREFLASTHAAPMAEERETAQWYMAGGIGADDAKKLLRAQVPDAEKTCFKFGSLAAWQPLPQAAKDALRRELYRIRAIGEEIDRRNQAAEQIAAARPSTVAEIAADEEARDQAASVDLTPAGMQTPEGIARVNAALREFEDATAAVANAAAQLEDEHDNDEDGPQEWQVLRDALANRRQKQDAFLRAIANRS